MRIVRQIKFGDILHERYVRLKPDEAEALGLKRIEKIDFSGNITLSQKPTKTDMILIKDGDFVMSGINAAKGAVGVYHGEEDVLATIHYSAYQFDESEIEVEYLKFLLKSEYFLNKLRLEVPGGLKTELKAKHILPLEIDLPDPDSQKEIIARLQNLSTLHTQANAALERLQADVKRLRQSILQQAIQGKLVDNTLPPGEKTGAELLAEIRAEKERRARAEGKKAPKPLPPVSEEEKPFELPEGWVWCRLGNIARKVEYGTSKKSFSELTGGVPVLRMNNIKDGEVRISNLKYVNPNIDDLPRLLLRKGDILFNRTNSFELVGKAGVFHGSNIEMTFASYLIRVSLFEEYVLPDYVNFFINSDWCRKNQIEPSTIQQNGQANFNGTKLQNVLVPLPPFLIQREILKSLDGNFKNYGEFETTLAQFAKKIERLWQSEMQQTFKFESNGKASN